MAVVTVNGQIGAGGNEVGLRVARLLDADYVDRLILSESAKRIGSTVQVLEMKEQRSMPLRDRLASFLQSVLERSAISGVGGEPYFAPGMEYLPAYEYTELAQEEPLTSAQRLNNDRFMDVTSAVIRDLASGGNVVLIGRGSNMILHGEPKVFHVGLVAPWTCASPLSRKGSTSHTGTPRSTSTRWRGPGSPTTGSSSRPSSPMTPAPLT